MRGWPANSHPIIRCHRAGCGHSYSAHDDGGGQCSAPCVCSGFLWVDPTAPADNYSTRPAPSQGA